ncbi:MAG: TonB-dependent receptor plug domain-containing protein, partial [bacterium]
MATTDFSMRLATTKLEEIVTTGTVTEARVRELATPITIVTADDIQRLGITRVDQLFRGTVPGGVSWDQGTTDYYSTIAVRGGSSLAFNSIKTYVDGVEVADNLFVATIDPNSIDRVEILRGPQASAVYGAGAISGVVQIFTKKGRPGAPRPVIEGRAAVGGIQSDFRDGPALRQEYNLGVGGGTSGFTYHFEGTLLRRGEWIPSHSDRRSALIGGARLVESGVTADFSLRYETKSFTPGYDLRLRDLGYSEWLEPPTTREGWRNRGAGVNLAYHATTWWDHNLTLGFDRYSYTVSDRPTPTDSALYAQSTEYGKESIAYNTTVRANVGESITTAVTLGGDDYYVANTALASA